MAQSGFTPILLYASGTASAAPSAGNLTSSASGAELALNYADGKLFYKDSGGVVQTLATKATGTIGGSTTQVQYNLSGALAGSANLTFDGTSLTLGGNPTLSAGTANGVLYLNGSKVATSGSALTFDGTNLGVGVVPAGSFRLEVGGSDGTNIVLRSTGTTAAKFRAYVNGAESGVIGFLNGGGQFFEVAGSEQMRLTSTGLGIGTSSPGYKLTVNGFTAVSGPQAAIKQVAEGNAFAGIAVQRSANDSTLGLAFNSSADAWQISASYASTGAYKPIQLLTSDTVRATLDSSGNLGLGVTPSASWSSGTQAIQFGPSSALYNPGSGSRAVLASNAIFTSGVSTATYITSNAAAFYDQDNGTHKWHIAPSGTAGNAISFTQAVTLNASSQLLVNQTASGGSAAKLQVGGANGTTNAGAIFAVEKASEGYGLYVGVEGTGASFIQSGTANDSTYYNLHLQRNGGNVGIGTSSPGQLLDISKSQNAQTAARVANSNAGASAEATFIASNGTYVASFGVAGASKSTFGALLASDAYVYSDANVANTGIVLMANSANGVIKFAAGGSAERARIDSSGNFMVGKTSANHKIETVGAAVDGNAVVSVTTATTIYTVKQVITGAMLIVFGDDGSNGFMDMVFFLSGNAPVVDSSRTMYGSPPARTYTASGSNVQLAMASGTYSVRTAALTTLNS